MPPVPPSPEDISKVLNAIEKQNLHETHREARAIWSTLNWVSGRSTHIPDRFITAEISWMADTPPDLTPFRPPNTRRVTVVHLTNPEVRAGNIELANAYGHGWEVRNVPDDSREHPHGKPCPVCSHDIGIP
jgi:hypothetical protein